MTFEWAKFDFFSPHNPSNGYNFKVWSLIWIVKPQHYNTHWNFSNDSMLDLNKICFWNFNLGTPQESQLSTWKCNWESWELHSCTLTHLSLIQDHVWTMPHLSLTPNLFPLFSPNLTCKFRGRLTTFQSCTSSI
jgi:hypothetical protein